MLSVHFSKKKIHISVNLFPCYFFWSCIYSFSNHSLSSVNFSITLFFLKFLEVSRTGFFGFIHFKDVVFISTSFLLDLASVSSQVSNILFPFALVQGTDWVPFVFFLCPLLVSESVKLFPSLSWQPTYSRLFLENCHHFYCQRSFCLENLQCLSTTSCFLWNISELFMTFLTAFRKYQPPFAQITWCSCSLSHSSLVSTSLGFVTHPHYPCVTTEQWATKWGLGVFSLFITQSSSPCCLFYL